MQSAQPRMLIASRLREIPGTWALQMDMVHFQKLDQALKVIAFLPSLLFCQLTSLVVSCAAIFSYTKTVHFLQ